MAAAFKEAFGLDTSFTPSSGGIIEVKLDGNVVWTNDQRRGYKPTNEEAVAAMRPYLASGSE